MLDSSIFLLLIYLYLFYDVYYHIYKYIQSGYIKFKKQQQPSDTLHNNRRWRHLFVFHPYTMRIPPIIEQVNSIIIYWAYYLNLVVFMFYVFIIISNLLASLYLQHINKEENIYRYITIRYQDGYTLL